ncbi:MAG: primosomal protein N', partial [Verrucomicrobiales bacterium]|nr:primosomal protein N' [Verrucomicrobiales bacterium]
ARRHDFAGFYDAEMEFRGQLKYPPYTRAAMLTLRGRNEEKVVFSAEHLKKAIEPMARAISDLVLAGPAPAPLLRAEAFYRYQIMLRTGQMSALSRRLAEVTAGLSLPEEVTLTVDIDPMNLM